MTSAVITGDSLDVMRGMAAGSVDAIVTSPPYADQRAYEPGEITANAPLFAAVGPSHDPEPLALAFSPSDGEHV